MDKKLVLASSSPRRIELLKQIGFDFEVIPAHIEEEKVINLNPDELVKKIAVEKVISVSRKVRNSIVIGADTLVYAENKILGKPGTEKEALDMLLLLSNKWHKVYSGIAVLDTETQKLIVDVEESSVKFKGISEKEARNYIQTGEPMDKAGAYAIQGRGAVFIERIEGCYYNIVGLPLFKLVKLLEQFNVYVF
ncbi:Maf family protein [Thermovenabulum gondwanense]|uniref:dTTP/UTP pyrophosphatase n=1 Tax=Thermovenabulum gondwanense TaxID=520767 RepID=A0A162MAA1_9FIRM|nr:Maf family protein [Thermovenabulum gondwanense]KYO64779.1 Septum formation protein Maf [Thermovenabulum gondwanense]